MTVLEGGVELTACAADPSTCERSDDCATRIAWYEASRAMFERLSEITISDLLQMECNLRNNPK